MAFIAVQNHLLKLFSAMDLLSPRMLCRLSFVLLVLERSISRAIDSSFPFPSFGVFVSSACTSLKSNARGIISRDTTKMRDWEDLLKATADFVALVMRRGWLSRGL